MKVDCDKALKPVKKLRKLLKGFPSVPTVEDVHALRTQCRKLEAGVHVLGPDDRRTHRMAKAVKPLRKAAGHVRDLDVLIEKAMHLNGAASGEEQVLLVERLAEQRTREARQLHKLVKRRQGELRRLMKSYQRNLKKLLSDCPEEASPAAPQVLAAQLTRWPKLHATNLHDFRIQAKELRYILQLSPEADRHKLEMLTRVKDETGEWHDWLQLEHKTRQMMAKAESNGLLRAIHKTTREHLRAALSAANALRREGLTGLVAAG